MDLLLNALRLSDCASSTRATSPGVTSTLDKHWPEVADRLTRYLRGRGVNPTEAEDLVQDVAVKVIARDVPFLDTDDLLRWCLPVARNLSIDQFRRGKTAADAAPAVHEAAARPQLDVVDHVLSRARLRSALTALRTMPASDQQAIYASIHGDTSGPLPGAIRVRALRARARLAEMTASAGAFVLPLVRLGRRSRVAGVVAGPAVAASLLLAIAVSPGNGGVGTELDHPAMRGPAATTSLRSPVLAASVNRADASGPAPSSGARMQGRRPDEQARHQRVAAVSAPGAPDAVVITSHDRRSEDTGIVCADGLPAIAHLCALDNKRKSRRLTQPTV